MTLREKLMHYTHDLDCGVDLKKEAIATIEHIAQYMDEDELLHHSRPLAIAYLALTEGASVPVVHAQWIEDGSGIIICPECKRGYNLHAKYTHYCPNCGAKMDGGADHAAD